MCTAVLRVDPAARWPLLLAFVRDEDRTRPTSPPAAHWSDQPTVVGARDDRRGGTWLAVDTDAASPRVAFVLNHFDLARTQPAPAQALSRGLLPLRALEHGGLDGDAIDLARMEPFNLLHADRTRVAWWRWDGERLDATELGAGWHLVASRGTETPDARRRADAWLPRFQRAEPAIEPVDAPPADAWQPWLDLLDGRAAEHGDADSLVVAGIEAFPDFGTSSGTLVALGAEGDVRYEFNDDWALAPEGWRHVRT